VRVRVDLIVIVICHYSMRLKLNVRMHDKQSCEEQFEKTDNEKSREREREAKGTERTRASVKNREMEA